jgi:O-antigen/teichoic acid export membrane protein
MYKVSLINLKSLKTRIISGWNVFLGLLAPNLYNALPIIFLGSTADPREYAKFAISLRICNIIFTLQNVLSKAIYPILSKLKGNNLSKVVMLNFIITAPCTAFLMIWGNDLLYIFLGYDLNSNIYLTIIPVSMIFVGIANSFSIGFFLPKSYDVVYRNISIRVSFISAAITYFLIMYFGVLGGAIGLLTARIILSSDYYFMYMKLTKLEVGFK